MTEIMKFEDVELVVVHRHGDMWFTARDVARALGYERPDFVLRLYARNAAEFSEAMSGVVKLTAPSGGGLQDVRVFSLRGAHLIGMLAKTDRARAFRRWVLDVLDGEASPAPRSARSAPPLLGDWRAERRRHNRVRHRLTLIAALRAELAALGVDEGDEDLYGEGAL